MSEQTELLNCPFCGGKADLTSGGPLNEYVKCYGCGVSTDDGSKERAIASWNRRPAQPESVLLAEAVKVPDGWRPPQNCDGKEQLAFEEWASGHGLDMHEHPLHYLFMDPKTDAARQAWKGALAYVRKLFSEAALAAPAQPVEAPKPQVKVVGAGDAAVIKQAVGECLAGMLHSEVSKDARRKIENAIDRAAAPKPAWLDMASAPKDGTMLRLLVVPDQEEFTAFDDSLTPYETIGSNSLADTQEDRWEFAGWDWQQDCFITGRGEAIGWMPFRAADRSQLEDAVRWCLDRDQRNGSLPEAYAQRLRAALATASEVEG